ncbi:MAG: hydantoinase/oxoprolinase family protein [Candidatus Sericytochromatia bacterium]|nr:hydantoinase/oxoprolinase family protein [Candidatus Tanganyikabacteria bacterium]
MSTGREEEPAVPDTPDRGSQGQNWITRLRDFFTRPPEREAPPAEAAAPPEPGAPPMRRVRVGIDVGGTFTHAVALDAGSLAIVARVKVPTTHAAAEGVAAGIVQVLKRLLDEAVLLPAEIAMIAHSTTQATNALLEGDVSPVGIIGLGRGADAWLARRATRVGALPLAPGHALRTFHRFLDVAGGLSEPALRQMVSELASAGAEAFVVSGAFSVDEPEIEARAVELLRSEGRLACAGHEISQLYGLRSRTRTAVLNASMLPKMIETADMTERSVREAGIAAPLMVMRSDGGVMALDEMRRRPILTMLSGPAAGVAAAMMYVKLSDGIFLEVGGTSTDISCIRNGKAQVRSAELGGHRLYLRTLDVRTVGVAGGSMARARGGKVYAVGPRSAHIAGLGYAAFPKADMKVSEVTILAPRPGDPEEYVGLRTGKDVTHTITTTCAANFAGLVPPGDPAEGNRDQARIALERVAKVLGSSAEEVSEAMLASAAAGCQPVVERLIAEYKLDRRLVTLMGGGGGAAAIVPYLAKKLGLRHVLAENADVVSAIGVALALVRETIERTMINPTNEDLLRLRREAEAAVARLGAAQGTIEVQIEVDAQKHIVRAIATGATELRTRDLGAAAASDMEVRDLVARSVGELPDAISKLAETEGLAVWGAEIKEVRLGGLWKVQRTALRVVDRDGVVRLQTNRGALRTSRAGQVVDDLRVFLEMHAKYGDGGKEIPDCFVLRGRKILDLTGLLNAEQVVSLTHADLEGVTPDEPVVLVGALRG